MQSSDFKIRLSDYLLHRADRSLYNYLLGQLRSRHRFTLIDRYYTPMRGQFYSQLKQQVEARLDEELYAIPD